MVEIYEASDRHFAVKEAITDALGRLDWPNVFGWFHCFGITCIETPTHLLRVGVPEVQVPNGKPSYSSIVASVMIAGGPEIARQEFPFNHYDSAKPKNGREIITLVPMQDHQYHFTVSSDGKTPLDPKKVADRLRPLCGAVFKWAKLILHGAATSPIASAAAPGSPKDEIPGPVVGSPRPHTGTDPDHVVVLEDGHEHDHEPVAGR